MKQTILDINNTSQIAQFIEAFEVYLREYLRKTDKQIEVEKKKMKHCFELVNLNR